MRIAYLTADFGVPVLGTKGASALRHPERAAQLRRLCDQFRQAYFELAPAVSPRRLAVYEALDLSAYVLRNFRKRSHQTEWLGWAKGQIESAWERLDHAAAGGRSASS
jgi:hypothetical protein